MEPRRGPLTAGEKVQFTDRKGKKITDQLVAGGSTQTEHGLILHDDVIGKTEGTVILTVHAKREAQVNQVYPEKDKNKPWKSSRAIGGWEYAVMRPRLADYVLSMPRGAQIMYPKDIAQVIQLGDIRSGMRVLESGAGSGAMSVNLLDAVGERGHLTTIELRPEFAKVAEILAAAHGVGEGWRYTSIEMVEPAKAAVAAFDATGTVVHIFTRDLQRNGPMAQALTAFKGRR